MGLPLSKLLYVLVLCFWLKPALSHDNGGGTGRGSGADPNIVPQLIPSQLEEMPSFPVVVDRRATRVEITDIVVDSSLLTPPVLWDSVRENVLREIQPLLRGLEALGRELRQEAGSNENFLTSYVDKDMVVVKIEGLGHAQLNTINGEIFTRVVHHSTNLAIFFFDENTIHPETRGFKRMVARQHLLSGETSARGKRLGRDLVFLWQTGTEPQDSPVTKEEYAPRHIPGTREWWREYWAHLYDGQRTSDHWFMAGYSTVLQMGTLYAVEAVRRGALISSEFDWNPMLVSGVFGFGLGLYSDIYKNWTYAGSDASKAAKMSMVSMFHTYSFGFLEHGVWKLFRIYDPESILIHVQYISNIFLSRVGRVPWQKLPEIREWMRANTGKIKIPFFEPKSRAKIEAHTFYIIPFFFSWMGRMSVGSPLRIPFTPLHINPGTVSLLSSIPLANIVVWGYAKWNKYPNEPALRVQMINGLKVLLIYPIPGMVYRFIRDAYSETVTDVIPLARTTFQTVVRPALANYYQKTCHKMLSLFTSKK